jgi:hypothetical protein
MFGILRTARDARAIGGVGEEKVSRFKLLDGKAKRELKAG